MAQCSMGQEQFGFARPARSAGSSLDELGELIDWASVAGHLGHAGPEALPDNPGEVFADSAYRGNHFRDAVRA